MFFRSLFLLSLIGFGYSDESSHDVELGGDDFDKFISENEHVLVKFYAPWCGHCKKMAPDYSQAAKTLKDKGSNVRLAKVDATKSQEVAERYEVRGYPTLMFFRKKINEEYTGGRVADEIVSWLESMTGPATIVIKEDNEAQPTEPYKSNFIGVFKNQDSENYKIYQKIADSNRQLGKFYVNFDPATKEHVRVERKDEETFVLNDLNEEKMKQFVNVEYLPLYAPISGDNFRNYFDKTFSLVWICGETEFFEKTASLMRSIARDYRDNYAFIFLDINVFKGHAEHNLDVKEFPALVIHGKEGRYVMKNKDDGVKLDNEILDEKKVREFVKNVDEKKVPRALKSEEPPAEDESTPVKIVVGKTFEEIVLKGGKDVMLEVYAPWCGHCKKLEPIYNELAEKIKDSDVVIAKMDGTLNEVPVGEFTWQGFPSIFFLRKGENIPQKYEGQRTLEAMYEFIEKNKSSAATSETSQKEEL